MACSTRQLRSLARAFGAGVVAWGGAVAGVGAGVVAGVCGGTVASGAPLDPSIIPADSAWVVHIDMDAWRSSELGRAMMHSDSPVRSVIEVLHRDLGVDVVKDLQSASFVGWGEAPSTSHRPTSFKLTSSAPPDAHGEPREGARPTNAGPSGPSVLPSSRGVTILQVSAEAAQQFAQSLRDANQAEDSPVRDVKEARLEVDGREVERRLSWRLEGAPWAATVRPRGASTMVVLGQDEGEIDRVIAGQQEVEPRAGGARALTLRNAPKAGAMVTVRAGAEIFGGASERASRSAIFRDAAAVELDVVEQRDEGGDAWVSLDASMTLACDRTALRAQQAIQGLIALGVLTSGEETDQPGDEDEPPRDTDTDLQGVVNAIQCEREGSRVLVRARQSTTSVVAALRLVVDAHDTPERNPPEMPVQNSNK
jgi:hypothetical protein